MCTVTFIPTGNSQFALTTNRDEAPNRKTLPPDFYKIDNTNMLFPKDEIAGGTWVGVSDKQRLVCVLNGGFTLHERKASYRMSRGVVAKDVMTADNVVALIDEYNLNDIEPFTLVIVDWSVKLKLYELVWDGNSKHLSDLPIAPKLWSSSTLYNENMKAERQQWFSDYLKTEILSTESILEFHKIAGKEHEDYGVVMDRGFVKTTSRTQVEKSYNSLSMKFHDLKTDEVSNVNFEIPETINE